MMVVSTDLGERPSDLCIDLGNIMLAQMRQPCRDPRRHRQHARADCPQHVRPFRLDGAGLDQLAPQAGGSNKRRTIVRMSISLLVRMEG